MPEKRRKLVVQVATERLLTAVPSPVIMSPFRVWILRAGPQNKPFGEARCKIFFKRYGTDEVL